MITFSTIIDEYLMNLPELENYLGREVQINIKNEEYHNNIDEESLWLQAISKNPEFDFLLNESEDIYSINDGEPINALGFDC